ncbi:TPA: hypothetical protein ACODIZ_003648 [Salmonella enterica subsp. enterica serovar Newport]
MPAIIELKEVERAQLIKLLNNLNLGFTFTGFGEAFVAMLDGAPVTLTHKQKAELPTLINNLNLGFAHLNAGALLVGLLDATTQRDAAKAMTNKQKAGLKDLLNRLNLGLHKHDVGGLVELAIDTLSIPVFDHLALTAPDPNAITGNKDIGYTMAVGPKIDASDTVTVTLIPNAGITLPDDWTVAQTGGTKNDNAVVTKVAGAGSTTFTITAAGTTKKPAADDTAEITVTAGPITGVLTVTFVAP